MQTPYLTSPMRRLLPTYTGVPSASAVSGKGSALRAVPIPPVPPAGRRSKCVPPPPGHPASGAAPVRSMYRFRGAQRHISKDARHPGWRAHKACPPFERQGKFLLALRISASSLILPLAALHGSRYLLATEAGCFRVLLVQGRNRRGCGGIASLLSYNYIIFRCKSKVLF